MTLIYNNERPIILNRPTQGYKSKEKEVNLKFISLSMNISIISVFVLASFILLIGIGAILDLHMIIAGLPLFGAAGSFFILGLYLLKIKKQIIITQSLHYLRAYLQTEEGEKFLRELIKESSSAIKDKVN